LLLAKDFSKIYFDQYKALPMMVPDLFNVMSSEAAYEKTSGAGTVPDFSEFTGKVSEVSPTQKYDKTYTFTEYAAKIEIQRKLAADDQYRVMSRYPKGLANSASRSREKLGAQVFSLAFTYAPTDGDGVALCSTAHPSNVTGVASQSNVGTTAMSATQIETIRQAMAAYRDDIGELISCMGDTIIAPRALEQTAWEIINSKGKVDTANNNANFHQGKYKLVIWDRLTDTNNYFVTEYARQKEYLLWWNREAVQFFQDKDSNTMVAIYLGYYRVGTGWDDWTAITPVNTKVQTGSSGTNITLSWDLPASVVNTAKIKITNGANANPDHPDNVARGDGYFRREALQGKSSSLRAAPGPVTAGYDRCDQTEDAAPDGEVCRLVERFVNRAGAVPADGRAVGAGVPRIGAGSGDDQKDLDRRLRDCASAGGGIDTC